MWRSPQYAHRWRSRANSSELVRLGACGYLAAPLPLIARIDLVEMRERSPFLLVAAPEFAHGLPDRPGDELLGVVRDGLLQLHPGLGKAGEIDGEDKRLHGLGPE